MCYRDNVLPLSFDSIHTACISGDNGNGKSSLIDAITWVMWGKARANSDDELIHQGQSEMEVEFEFTLGQQLYRIIRKRTAPKKQRGAGQSILEFQISTGDGFRSISGNIIAETQKKIIDTLHMTYETFTNSAFLRQGHADEFTTKRPGERKEVLASILQLSVYDELEENARNMAKQQEMEITSIESSLKDMDEELSQKPVYEALIIEAQNELAQIDETVKGQESNLNSLRSEMEALKTRQSQLTEIENQISSMQNDISRWENLATEHNSHIKEYETIISRSDEVEDNYTLFANARKLYEELDEKARHWASLNQKKHNLDMSIVQAQQELLKEHALAESKISELEIDIQKIPQLKEKLRQEEAGLTGLSEKETLIQSNKSIQQQIQKQVNNLESNIARLQHEIKDIDEKLKLLLSQQQTVCPLCETELGSEEIDRINGKYNDEHKHKTASLNSNQLELNQKKTELNKLNNDIPVMEKELNQARTDIQNKISVIKKEIEDSEIARNQINEARNTVSEIEQRLTGKDFAHSEQRALSELEAELARIDYNSQKHDEVRQSLTSLRQHEETKRKLEEAKRLVDQERKSATGAEDAARQLRASLTSTLRKQNELALELKTLPDKMNSLTQVDTQYREVVARQKAANEALWNVKTKLERCNELEARKKERGKQIDRIAKEEKIYKDLAQAFGKGGIQAMLIETAIPEIEAEANQLLARMTNNRMHVKIETQRETKKGSTLETLDINISDELGTRNYEMYSGGEAFRIDFAIRIALSKLLARRVGAPLRTLIIDEGFGTQDNEGIEKIKEAINSIQDDFDKLLVITHIEELRDAFPTRINITKTAEGSTIELN